MLSDLTIFNTTLPTLYHMDEEHFSSATAVGLGFMRWRSMSTNCNIRLDRKLFKKSFARLIFPVIDLHCSLRSTNDL